jgi:FkbM family methyltransferase
MISILKKIKQHFFPHIPSESIEMQRKREAFYSQFVKPNDLVFDVGANIGNRTQPLLNVGAKIVAIEPQEKCYQILEKKFGSQIEIIKMGLGEKEEQKDFFIADAHTISSFSTEWIESVKKSRFKNYTWSEPIKINMTTLDHLIAKYGIPKFIKIDVEGFEHEVLKGLTQPIDIISFEYTVPEQTQNIYDCLDQIEKYNRQIECNFSNAESMELSLIEWKSIDEFKNFVKTQEFMSSGFGDLYVRKIDTSFEKQLCS